MSEDYRSAANNILSTTVADPIPKRAAVLDRVRNGHRS